MVHPAEITETLRGHGHHVMLLRDVLPIRSLDPVVIAKAQKLGVILHSLNGDFADIVSHPPGRYWGIVGLQLPNRPEIIPQRMGHPISFLDAHSQQEFYHSKLFLVEVHRIRIRQSASAKTNP